MTNRAGYTLIEVLVSFALVALMVGAMGALFQTSFKGANLVEMRNSAANMNLAWQQTLNKPDICEKNFKGLGFDSSGLSTKVDFTDLTGKSLIAAGVTSSNKDLLIKSVAAQIRPDNWIAFQAAQATLGTNTYIANIDIAIELDRQKDLISSKSSSLAVSVPVYLNAAGTVAGCLSTQAELIANAQQVACEQMGGTFDSNTSQCSFNQDCANIPADSAVSKQCFDQLTKDLGDQISNIGKSTTSTAPISAMAKTIKSCLADSQGAVIDPNKTTCILGSTTFSATPTSFSYGQGAYTYTLTDPILTKYLFDLVTKYQTDGLTKITVGAQ